jgi:hypothetical protein
MKAHLKDKSTWLLQNSDTREDSVNLEGLNYLKDHLLKFFNLCINPHLEFPGVETPLSVSEVEPACGVIYKRGS